MRIKTMVIILITVLITVVLMQNTDQVKFNFLFSTFYMPKLVMLTAISASAFILGILVGRPKKVRSISGDTRNDPRNDEHEDDGHPGTLSDEDRDYISHP